MVIVPSVTASGDRHEHVLGGIDVPAHKYITTLNGITFMCVCADLAGIAIFLLLLLFYSRPTK